MYAEAVCSKKIMKKLLDPGQAVSRNHSYRQWYIHHPSIAWGGKSLQRMGRREVEKGGIETWGRCRGKEEKEKYRRNSKQTGRYVREE